MPHSYSAKCCLPINRNFLYIDREPVLAGISHRGELKGWLYVG